MSLRGLIKGKAPLGLSSLLDDVERHPNRNTKANYRLLQFYKETVEPTNRYYRYILNSLKDLRIIIRKQSIASLKRKQTVENRKQPIKSKKQTSKTKLIEFMNNVRNTNQSKQLTLPSKDFRVILETIKEIPGFNILIGIGGEVYTLNQDFKNNIEKIINEETEEEQYSSGQEIIAQVRNNEDMIIEYRKKSHIRNARHGAFFQYYNNTIIDLTRYGIYKNIVEYDKEKRTNCLELALKNSGIKTKKFLYDKMNNASIPMNKLKQLAEDLKVHIDVMTEDNSRHHHFNKDAETTIRIGLIKDHYFTNEKTKITSFALKNYDNIKHHKDFERIVGMNKNGKPKWTKTRFIDSYNLVKLLLENKDKLLAEIPFEEKLRTQYYESDMEIKDLHYDWNSVRYEKKKERKDIEYSETVYFDFEASTDGDKHSPYMVCFARDNEDKIDDEEGDVCAVSFLNTLKDNSLSISHNLSYDASFLNKHLKQLSIIKKGKSTKSIKAKYYNPIIKKVVSLFFKDSASIIPNTPLKDFSGMFKLGDIVKEIMPYNLYTRDNVKKNKLLIEDALKELSEDDRIGFLNNIKEWNLELPGGCFNHIEYAKIYCRRDVEVLKKGYQKFKDSIKQITNIDIDKEGIISLPQLAYRYKFNEGCYDDVVEMSGIPQHFIAQACIGGRVMTANNEKIHYKGVLNDFDAVSLYPSSMIRMKGYVKGKPIVIEPEQLNYEFLSQQSEYFVEIVITKINKKQDFPLISYVYNNKRNFTNEPRDQPIVVDKTTLEDLIEFHQIEYRMIRGYYFNEGFNDKVNEVMQKLFQERRKQKADGNPIQQVYKLFMNSSYGKNGQKAIKSDTVLFTDEHRFNVYVSRNYNFIKSYSKTDNIFTLKTIKPINNHFNRVHLSSIILSTSKRIMSEVMCLAKDMDIKILYTDTDSMHIEDARINELAEAFKNKYGRELRGGGVGQFHEDFDSKRFKKPKSVESYFLAKKIYIDKLCENGIDSDDCEYHIRMKSVGSEVVINKKKNDNSVYPPMEQYDYLYNRGTIMYDLTTTAKRLFKQNRDLTFSKYKDFKRNIYVYKD